MFRVFNRRFSCKPIQFSLFNLAEHLSRKIAVAVGLSIPYLILFYLLYSEASGATKTCGKVIFFIFAASNMLTLLLTLSSGPTVVSSGKENDQKMIFMNARRIRLH